jgi:hypothetical protein
VPLVRMLVRYPGDPHPTGTEVELAASEASELVISGRAEYVRDPGLERAVPREVETTTPMRRRRKTR